MSISTKPISAIALVPYPLNTAPSQRYRLEQWLPFLNAQGITIRFFPFADQNMVNVLYKPGRLLAKGVSLGRSFLRSASQLGSIRQYDVVLIHRAISIAGPALLEWLTSLLRRPIIYDFDDAIYRLHTSHANRWFGWLKFPGKTATICRLSSHITVGNAFLADFARQFNSKVTIIPSSVDTDRYRPMHHIDPGRPVVVGWTGSSTSQTHLELFAPVLKQLLERRPVEIRVISDRKPVLPGVPLTWREWSPQSEAEEVGQFDIGIMPMPDDVWSRGKCAFKALQYMAMGVPPVCSPIGTNTEVITHGENGLLAATTEEWLTQLEMLIDKPDFRRRLGVSARKTVEQRYSMRYSADLFAGVMRSVVNNAAVTPVSV
jgi:glycosyltransferase involved in cell wall biosynthesis